MDKFDRDLADTMIQPQPHTGSYYAKQLLISNSDCQPLKGAQSADVCVVGGGFTGISTALHWWRGAMQQ